MESLLESAMAIARQHDGELVVVTVAEVPEGETLFSGRRQVRELEPVLDAAVRYAEERGVAVRPVIKIARRIGHGLAQTAREEGCNFLVIGQPSTQSFFERLVASIVERVLQDAPCHVAVVYGGIDKAKVTRIVVPVTRGGNSKLAAELATPFSRWFEAPIRALTVVERAAAANGGQEQAEDARETLRAAGSTVELEVLLRAETNTGLLRNLKRGELVLIGAPSSGPVVPLFGETIPALIAKRGRNPVVVVRHVEELQARRFEQLFFARS